MAYTAEKKAELDDAVFRRLVSVKEFKSQKCVFVYVSRGIEVDTVRFIERCFELGKMVAAPRCNKENHTMDFYYIESFDDLEIASYNLLEPDITKCRRVEDLSTGICIVPGLSFDSEGFRLGFGMGYYDRFLSHFGGKRVGICYSDCIRWRLPHGYFDRRVDMVVTEKYIRNFSL